MKVLVTGSDGFIGRHLTTALFGQGHQVIQCDLPDQDITKPLEHARPLDAVVHLAAIASPALCDRDPATAFRVNVQGTHNVLKLAVAAGAKRFVLASSAHVYGISPRYMPTDERHPLWLQDTYTTTKILSEQLCQLFWENYGLSYCAIRLFNGYGPGQPAGYFIPDKLKEAQKGSIDLKGSNITKDWVFITDVVAAYIKALESAFVGPVNIGTGIETDLGTIASIIAAFYKAELTVQPSDNPTRMQCDWIRARRILGWEPRVTVLDGLQRIVGAITELAQ